MPRFIFNGTSCNGYYCIIDNKQPEFPIWIDCNIRFIDTIVTALNIKYAKEK